MASAPPLPPSPVTTQTIGVGRPAISRRLRAMASACPRSSAPRPGIGAGRVDERDDGLAELGRELHQPERLAVALGVRHAEVARDVLAGVAPLLVADHHHRLAVEAGEAAHDRLVVAEDAVAVQLDAVLEQQADEVERVRALRVPGDLGALPGGQARVDRCCWRASRSSSFAISSRAASGSSEARSSAMRFSSSRSGFSNSSSSGILDEYTARPEQAFDFRHQVGRRLHRRAP